MKMRVTSPESVPIHLNMLVVTTQTASTSNQTVTPPDSNLTSTTNTTVAQTGTNLTTSGNISSALNPSASTQNGNGPLSPTPNTSNTTKEKVLINLVLLIPHHTCRRMFARELLFRL